MLVLSRKAGQIVRIGDNIEVRVIRSKGKRYWLGLSAPKEVKIVRDEASRKEARRQPDREPVNESNK